jgi:MarR family transcriptional regulator, organic hydroperoxide resistance regulator
MTSPTSRAPVRNRKPIAKPVRRPTREAAPFAPPLTVSHAELLAGGTDVAFRQSLYLMVLAFSRLQTCREAFGRVLGLTGTQFAVLIGTAYRQGQGGVQGGVQGGAQTGVSIRALADHIQLASTHVTTEVGRLIDKGLLIKSANQRDRRGVLVRLSRRGEAAVGEVAPFVRRVNDRLFAGISRRDFAAVSAFLSRFAANSEDALDEIRRTERTRTAHRLHT